MGSILPCLLNRFLNTFINTTVIVVRCTPRFRTTGSDTRNGDINVFTANPTVGGPFFGFLDRVVTAFAFVFYLLGLNSFAGKLGPLVVKLLVVIVNRTLNKAAKFTLGPTHSFTPELTCTVLPIPGGKSTG